MTPLFRTASLPEVRLMLDWAAAEGWNPGLEDAEAFHATDPEGFFVAEIDGQPVAAISVVNLSDSVAFLGLYLCLPAFRGEGIGYGLWRHALGHAGARTVGLDGVPAQEANYARSGFVRTGQSVRYLGHLAAPDRPADLIEAEDHATIFVLDHAATGIARPAFLRAWVRQTATRKTVALRDDGTLIGFATVRQCRDGCKIGPIVAPDADRALRLARQAAALSGESPVMIDLPASNTDLATALQDHGFSPVFSTARMYRGTAVSAGATLQAIASMELG